MYNPKKTIHHIELVWSSRNRKDESRGYANKKIKPPSQDLKAFIVEERNKGAQIFVDYMIDGINFAFWLNTNYYNEFYIGENIRSTMCFLLNVRSDGFDFKYLNFARDKITLKRMLGQLATFEEICDFWGVSQEMLNGEKSEEHKEKAKRWLRDTNVNTMLYCSGCCGDRMCGHFGIDIFHKKDTIIWVIEMYRTIEIVFDKKQYLEAFGEYAQLINNDLEEQGKEVVDIFAKVEEKKMIEEILEEGIKEFEGKFTFDDALELFKSGDVYKINLGFILSKHFGIDLSDFLDEIGLAHQGAFYRKNGWDLDQYEFLNMTLYIELENDGYTKVLLELLGAVESHLYYQSAKHIPKPTSAKWLRSATKLRIKCEITEIPPIVFELETLETLNLLNNKIRHIPKDILKLKNLKHLNIAYNELTELPAFVEEMNLETLNVKGNPFLKNVDVNGH